nr:M20 aminoacylase family protein [Azospirillum sp. TSO22-1]
MPGPDAVPHAGIPAAVAALAPAMTAWRRDLHAHPELGFEEHRTADAVAESLEAWGIDVHRGLAGTGVVGTIHGRAPSPRAIALRADLDALPIPEATGVPHASRHAGVMHACGHDGHTAMLLGAARHLAVTRSFAGTVHLVFQPAEEGRGGGLRMVEDGLFDRFPVDAVYGLHNWPDLPAGTFAVHPGPVMAACDQFTVRIRGKGGHAAMPHHGVDPVLVAAHLVTAVQSLVSRGTDPLDGAVLSVTRMEAGTTFNVIPDTAELHGTIRTFQPATRARLHEQLGRLVAGISGALGAEATLEIDARAPPTINTRSEADLAAAAAEAVAGPANVRRDAAPSMTAEDFGYMLAKRPGAYVWLGAGSRPLHSPGYDFDDSVLATGAAYWVALAERALPLP